ncbi:putative TRAP-type C4-dicarboxylate transport system, large permease component [Vibrio nigripulchritudo SFn27]|uniref:TRAP transporter large permease protein n=1 Tax=Vibrio nigripulchritudo TaxID=28173 RepID=U4JWR6_9VIBR|nr:TRAP transporter large permease [Vibrio nigripulchritudo]CCN83586.1 putative TRAP-type C4-dicarboxylate transport system, large permease component [Vibrio nigripulchritudo BLFn1]CCN87409.1 putative TRAP-type C4-dicarboxylate transport system, large permease component [Vibrio nigripulchritudo SFn27]CCN94788.1 putative TRAP-type C4-dicarboxylate transport system, large permease component [Vibrio nigripulchritudo ENn2]CCO40672.1 putative TRAP-type C4-dicarboxylate transport system, large permea
MSVEQVGIAVLLGSFFILMLLRVPIAFALGISSVLTAWQLDLPLLLIAQRMVNGMFSFTFLAVPFFILVGSIMTEGGISDRLVRFSEVLVGRFRGGMAQGNVVASTFFGGISGSSVADVASIGSFLIPAMKRSGYPAEYSVAVTVTSSVQGVLIPPSQNMIYYALAAGGLPISQLFIAGYVPGILLSVSLMMLCGFLASKNHHPKGLRYSFKEGMAIVGEASIGLLTIVIIIGGIVLGIFTATESAAVAVAYALLVTVLIYKSVTRTQMNKIMSDTLKTLSMVIAIIMTSSAFGYLLSFLSVPSLLADFILGLSENPYIILLAINVLLLVLGMLMDMGVLILILTPILLPIAKTIGVDPIHFGIIMLLNLGIGVCTPPVGTSLMVGCGIGKVKIEATARQMLPFYLTMVGVLMLVTYFPMITLWLPSLL